MFAAAAAAAAAPPSSLQMVPFDETRIVNGEVLDFANRRKPGRPKKPPTPATKAAEAKASVKRKLAAAGLGLIVSALAVGPHAALREWLHPRAGSCGAVASLIRYLRQSLILIEA